MGYVEYYGERDYPAALAQFTRAQEALPNDPDVIAAIAFIHRRQGKWRLALSELQRVAILDPRNPRRHYEIGVTLTELRHYDDAEQQLNQALTIEPNDYVSLIYKIRLLFLTGKTAQARRTLAAVPADVDPQGSFSALRFESAWLARKPDRALAALASAPTWVQSMNTLAQVPTNLLRAQARVLQGKTVRARKTFADARRTLRASLRIYPDNPPLLAALGVAEAGLGERQKAIRAGLRASRLLPVSRDAYYGTGHLASLARIYAQTGEAAEAVELLHRLLSMPAGEAISVPMLRLDPIWDPIRHGPRFQALLKQYGHSASAPQTAATDA